MARTARQYREIASSSFSEEGKREDDCCTMPGGISLEALETSVQHFSPWLWGVLGPRLETPRLKLVWPISSTDGCAWTGMHDMLPSRLVQR